MAFQDDGKRRLRIGDAEQEQGRCVAGGLSELRPHGGPIGALPAAGQGWRAELEAAACTDGGEVRELPYIGEGDGCDGFRASARRCLLVFDLHLGIPGDAALEADFIESFLALDRDEIGDGIAAGADGGGGGLGEAGDADAERF